MICQRCLHRGLVLRNSSLSARTLTTVAGPSAASPRPVGAPAATSTGAAQPFSTPLSPGPNAASLGVNLRPKAAKNVLPVSSAPAGTSLKGLNFLKGRDDPVALPEEEYPEWLWRCLEEKKADNAAATFGDEFFILLRIFGYMATATLRSMYGTFDHRLIGHTSIAKSKKQRRIAAKRQRKLEAQLLATEGADALAPKVPMQRQTIDLPRNEEGSISGALDAVTKREELRKAMRGERRAKIKESNFLKGFK
ncbi:MAG: hypothetical protein M1818_002104 [Claussenomyces sp. TS43310]|nr:MAG: hypothetical protein M1818_002104 [Claussenomyces sp. TS43310]